MNQPAVPRLKIENLEKIFGEKVKTKVLEGISFNVNAGEFIVLVGPSGCGKSTLLRLIAGLEVANHGNIYIDGANVNEVPASRRGLAMVFQDYALYPHMTVAENLSFALRVQRKPKADIARLVDHAADMLKLRPLLARKPAQLSGGQRQRVAIGRALVREPKIFLFDEPLSNLDAQLRLQMRIEIAGLHRQLGSTSIYVTHDQMEAMSLADRIVVLHQGHIQQIGTPMEVYHKPANEFVASFIGSPSMNLLKGELVVEGTRKSFRVGGTQLDLSDFATPAPGPLTLGVRPESVKYHRSAQGAVATALLHLTESHGHELQAMTEMDTQLLILRTSDPQEIEDLRSLRAQAPVPVRFAPNSLHWFDSNGMALNL